MEDNKIVKIAAVGFLALVVAPVVIGGSINVMGAAANKIINVNNKMKYNRKIKKGLKDGSIVEINGEYFEVEIKDTKEA